MLFNSEKQSTNALVNTIYSNADMVDYARLLS